MSIKSIVDAKNAHIDKLVAEFEREFASLAKGMRGELAALFKSGDFSHANIEALFRSRGYDQLAFEFIDQYDDMFEYAKQMQPLPAAIIYLTDGYGPAPQVMELPTLWVLTPEGRKPVAWGVRFHTSCSATWHSPQASGVRILVGSSRAYSRFGSAWPAVATSW